MDSSSFRDIRSTAQDAKRSRDDKKKWSHGARALPGVKANSDIWRLCYTPEPNDDDSKMRPQKVLPTYRVPSHNITKPLRNTSRWDTPQSHFRARTDAQVQVRDPESHDDLILEDHLGPANPSSTRDNFLYSFDSTDSPGKPLSLEMFVKTNSRATEKLVEKEYEVLDNNGDALKGRRARNNLRRRDNVPSQEASELVREEDGFELI